MKRLAALLTLLFALTLAAWEPMVIPTLMVNVRDQAEFVLPSRPVVYSTVREVESDQPFYLEFPIGIKDKTSGKMDITGLLEITSPDGKIETAFKDQKMFVLPSGFQGMMVSSVYLGMTLEKSDALGEYKFKITLNDGKESKSASASVIHVKSIADGKKMDAAEFNKFFDRYYLAPKPERLLAAWEYYLGEGVKEQLKREGKSFNPMAILYGFCEAFKLNPQFHDELAAASRKASPQYQQFYAVLFAGLGDGFLKKYQQDIDPEILKMIKERIKSDPFEIREIIHGFQLDMLWMEFFITGRFAPVKRLVNELRSRPVLTVEEVKKMRAEKKSLTAEERKQFMDGIIQSAAAWSLNANLKQEHRLLGYYLETVLAKKLYADKQCAAFINAIFKQYNSKKGNKK